MTQTTITTTISPIDGSVYVERALATRADLDRVLDSAVTAQVTWRNTPLAERIAAVTRFVASFTANIDTLADELTWQIGRPSSQAAGEIRGFEERARHMLSIAEESLKDMPAAEKDGFVRFVRREPLGVVFALAAWNYPYLISVNAVVPALLAGNTVVLKQSDQTLLCAERFTEAGKAAGLPDGVLQHLHMSHGLVADAVQDPRVAHVAFTGSVGGGEAVHRASAGRFIAVGLELGGKDPAYVRADCNLPHAIESLVDGAFFNTGQSCCGIERIYVHRDVYAQFVAGYVELVKGYKLGDPRDPETNLGPVVRARNAASITAQIDAAIAAGARGLIDPAHFPAAKAGTPYLAPQVLVDVDHSMEIMTEETFGPVVGIMAVDSDDEAIALMNDSRYGLTASIWTSDMDAALRIGDQIETGTFFMNRCDYLDPALAWVGVKDSGRGCTLSSVGFEHLTRPKSYHLRVKV
ncbi:MAG: aldehyde dehydrogenase family protein [Myxococcales bacterium]|nr:aldehyde dehydrogenase family protein [Myxococcales bacterium]